ncbi:MAG: hypothetical protein ACREXY_21930, partial [Gammaproteobacteria bacterium]
MNRFVPVHNILAFEIKGAFYAGLCGHRFSVHLDDPPSLLSADISKHAPTVRHLATQRIPWSRLGHLVRAEGVHQITRLGLRRADQVIVTTNAIGREVNE